MKKDRLLELAGVKLNEDKLPMVDLIVTVDLQLVGDEQLTNEQLKKILKNDRHLDEHITSAISKSLSDHIGDDKVDGVGTTVRVK